MVNLQATTANEFGHSWAADLTVFQEKWNYNKIDYCTGPPDDYNPCEENKEAASLADELCQYLKPTKNPTGEYMT